MEEWPSRRCTTPLPVPFATSQTTQLSPSHHTQLSCWIPEQEEHNPGGLCSCGFVPPHHEQKISAHVHHLQMKGAAAVFNSLVTGRWQACHNMVPEKSKHTQTLLNKRRRRVGSSTSAILKMSMSDLSSTAVRLLTCAGWIMWVKRRSLYSKSASASPPWFNKVVESCFFFFFSTLSGWHWGSRQLFQLHYSWSTAGSRFLFFIHLETPAKHSQLPV